MRAETRPTTRRSKPRPLTEAERETVAANRGLVYAVVASMAGPVDDDSIQAGTIALMRAVQLFDPDGGFKFATYAGAAIKHAVARHRRFDRLIHVPDYVTTGTGGRTDPSKYRLDAERASRVGRIDPGDADVASQRQSAETSAEGRELRDAVAREIARLPTPQRLVVERVLVGDGRKAIAAATGVEENRIGYLREVALKTLRNRLTAFA